MTPLFVVASAAKQTAGPPSSFVFASGAKQSAGGMERNAMDALKPRILCVDDEPQILRLLEEFLVQNGYEVVKGHNGVEALEKMRNERIDLVLSDVTMPQMDGFELCRQIKSDDRFRDIAVVMVTGLTAKEERVKGIEAGAEDFISKPIDREEVLARVRMLLKAREMHQKNIGQLLVDMGFITEQQLQEALILAREKNMKMGDALHALGILDKDRLYWVLSRQLKMNYVTLSPDMMDPELIQQFSIELLEELRCLPLYETRDEIHFAMADPTDLGVVNRIKGLRPEKVAQIHLALPETIQEILSRLRERERSRPRRPQGPPFQERSYSVSTQPFSPLESSSLEHVLGEVVSTLLSTPQGDVCWLFRAPDRCGLFVEKGSTFALLKEFPQQRFLSVKQQIVSWSKGDRLLIQDASTRHQSVFKWKHVESLDGDIVRFERIPEFSWESFLKSRPEIPDLVDRLRTLFRENRHLLIGGQDRLAVKQCCYAMLMAENLLKKFPPPIFVEKEIDIYFPETAQLTEENLLEIFRTSSLPFLFCEINLGSLPERRFLERFRHTVLYSPFSSLEAMREALAGVADPLRAGWRTLFFMGYQWELL